MRDQPAGPMETAFLSGCYPQLGSTMTYGLPNMSRGRFLGSPTYPAGWKGQGAVSLSTQNCHRRLAAFVSLWYGSVFELGGRGLSL